MRGYIALISILIISAVLILIVSTVSQLGIGRVSMAIERNQSLESSYVVEACAEEALMKLAESSSYSGDETITINGNNCQILPVENLGGESRRVKVSATLYNQTKRIKIEISQLTPRITVSSWEAVSSF